MNAAIVFHWEQPAALTDPRAQKKLFTRWTHTAKAFGVVDLFLIDVDGIVKTPFGDSEISLTIVDSLDEALLLMNKRSPVFVEQGGAPLASFRYPERPVFVFGSDYGQLDRADLSIPSVGPLHSDVACGLILADSNVNRWR